MGFVFSILYLRKWLEFIIYTIFHLFQGMPIQFLQDIGLMINIPLCKALFKDEWDDRKKRDFIPVLTFKLVF